MLLCYFVSLRTLNYCSYSRYDNQPQNSLNQITLNIIQKIMCQFTSLLTEHFDFKMFSMQFHYQRTLKRYTTSYNTTVTVRVCFWNHYYSTLKIYFFSSQDDFNPKWPFLRTYVIHYESLTGRSEINVWSRKYLFPLN